MSSPLLRLTKISLAASVGVDYLLRNISFMVNEAEKIALVGASGSGKTSLLRLLNCLSNPVEGEIFFQETAYKKLDTIALRRQIMLVPQEPKLLGMSGKDALMYPLQLQQLSSQEISDRLMKWCDALQIPQKWLERKELKLSLGQRQLIAIARALMLEPKILLLDEPTSALDRGKSDRLIAILNHLNTTNQTTILMVNHQLELTQKFAERILYLEAGKLLSDVPATATNWQQIDRQLLAENHNLDREWQEDIE